MDLLKRYKGDDFDESFNFDDAEIGEFEESSSSKPFLVKAIAMMLAVTGIAYGANIALTTAQGGKTEFGQGFVTAAACDTQDGITVIPQAGFINETGTAGASGRFTLDTVYLENIDKACVGDDFIIQVYGETGTALTLTESETALNSGNYLQFDAVRFSYVDSNTVVLTDTRQYADVYILTDTSSSTEFDSNQGSIQIVFDADRLISMADASLLRRITIQTVKTGS
ncbi:MAG: hypothetical protein F2531_05365 [Actinobacteria bacterium]|uniref:Unannotated protein n=1 Tax=freshwater metagenome TaxID=449393 RepID=A0A6J6CDZ3_9ZZZZ|nr:hypothetical protein [Actinomycetota bacterium]